jgi:acyl CoA:acetate/3-ketoacid CoA transferase alpha subunit
MTKKVDLPEFTAEQKKMIDQLSEANIRRIDQALRSNASTQWSRTDRIVLATMIELDNGMGLPTIYFAERIGHLVQEGLLESKGDLTSTRSGEVRLKD